MRAILIDAEAKSISEVEYDGDWKKIKEFLGCDLFTVVELDYHADDSSETLFVDDEGLLNEPKHFFVWKGYDQPLPGRGLIVGCDPNGDSIATSFSLEYVEKRVSFPELEFVGFEEIVPHKVMQYGMEMTQVGHKAIFRLKSSTED